VDDDLVVSAAELTERATDYLVARGAPLREARVQATHLVEAELRGHPSHGLRRLTVLGERIARGVLEPAAEPELTWVAQAALRVDGRGGFGPVAAYAAIDALRDRLDETGVAVASLHNTHHLGMLAPYVERICAEGAAGLVLSSTEGLVHPWGGAGALLGTNPIGIGIPAAGGDLIVDMSSGAVSAGKILDYRARGLPLPEGWAVDAAGEPTTDAAAAAEGAISPFGGAKGYALGLAFGSLVGALTGTAYGPAVRGTLDAETPTTKGDVIVVFHAALLAGGDERAALGAYLDAVRASGVRGPATIPGDRARTARGAHVRDGVRIAADVWALIAPATASATEPEAEAEAEPENETGEEDVPS